MQWKTEKTGIAGRKNYTGDQRIGKVLTKKYEMKRKYEVKRISKEKKRDD